MKTLILVLLSLLIPFEVESQPILLVPVLQDSVPDAYLAMYHDQIMSYFKPMSIWSLGPPPAVWFIWQDSSSHTSHDIETIRVWGKLSSDVQLTVCSGFDLGNYWTLSRTIENPQRTEGYGAYDYTFSTEENWPATFVMLVRYARKSDLSLNGQGDCYIDCVEAIPQARNSVALERTPSKALRYYDMLGREVRPNRSGVYVTSNHTKVIVVR